MQPETDSIELNLNHLLKILRLNEFKRLDAEGQISNIEEVRKLLKTNTCPYVNKKQLVNFMGILKGCDGVDEEAQRRIQIALDEWDVAPF